MKQTLLWVVIGVIVLVVAGLLVYRSTTPNGDVVPQGTANLEDRTTPAAGGQFLQLEPSAGPPVPTPSVAAPTAGDAPAAVPTDVVTISMTDTGFVPPQGTINSGTGVRFVNDGQTQPWPASAVHPTHEILPEFDSKQGVATGDDYSYTFTKTGTWNFHDHLNPR